MSAPFKPVVADSYSRPAWMPDLSCKVRGAIGGRLLQVSFPGAGGSGGGRRGKVFGFTSGCRRRLMRRLAQVSCTAELPAFVGQTFPDSALPRDCATANRHLSVFLKRLKRELPTAAGFWRLEMQPRKSGERVGEMVPHFHLLIWNVPSVTWGNDDRGNPISSFEWESDCAPQICWDFHNASVSGKLGDVIPEPVLKWRTVNFREWLSVTWYHVVGTHDLKHCLAGTSVSAVHSWRGVMSYCSKYMAVVRDEDAASEGRCWGVFNRTSVPWAKMVEVDLTPEAAYRLRRIGRRYIERSSGRRYGLRRGCGISLFCDADRWWSALVNSPP